MQREHKFLPLVIALIAGLAVSIVFILNHNNSITSVLIVLAVMLGFYIVGLIFRAVLVRLNTKEPEEVEEESETEETGEEDGVKTVDEEEDQA